MDSGPENGVSFPARRREPDRPRPDRVPPQNLEAEKGLLGCILLENTVFDDIADRLLPDHFYLDSHRRIFAAIKRLHDQGKHGFDAVTIAEELERAGSLVDCGGPAYLLEILDSVPMLPMPDITPRLCGTRRSSGG
jgi:replicative DNA helicase